MKLSEKGLGKLYNSKACYYDPETEEEVVALSYFEHVFEFEADDFTGAVVLSIEEAKVLTRCAANEFCRLILGHAPVDSARQVEVLMYDLVKRIGQAESEKAGDAYNKALNTVITELKKQAQISRLKREVEQIKADQARDDRAKERFLNSLEDKE